ncbi:MAG TPA: hypothetical protein VN285_13150 [Candidatus Deferrimicrobium sp.]|nr:hypothetical protein [Candidatus Deferrimicrobium sp.]
MQKGSLTEQRRFGLEAFFDLALFSSTYGLSKPHPNIFHEAARLAGRAPDELTKII